MTGTTVSRVDADPAEDMAPPRGTAIVRPLRHVRAVREPLPTKVHRPGPDRGVARSPRMGMGPGRNRHRPGHRPRNHPPTSRPEIEAEITVADERRLRGDRENRADAAATILRWLIGADDHVPVRGTNVGALVGGFGDIVRTRPQIANVLAAATEGHRQAVAKGRQSSVSPAHRQLAQPDAEYRIGVTATLEWVVGQRAGAPITSQHRGVLTATELKAERLHAEDVIEQAGQPWASGRRTANTAKASSPRSTGCSATPLSRPPIYPCDARGVQCHSLSGREIPEDEQPLLRPRTPAPGQ